MKKFLVVGFFLLTGCVTTPIADSAHQEQSYSCGFMDEVFGGVDCFKEQMDRKFSACETYKSWIEQSECKNRVVNSEPRYRNNRFFQEIVAYRSLLIEKVKAKQMTEAEARYALVQKASEIDRQAAAMMAEDRRLDLIERKQDMQAHQERMKRMNETIQQNNDRMMEAIKSTQQNTTTPAPVYTSPTTTNCEPNGYGGMRCTTY